MMHVFAIGSPFGNDSIAWQCCKQVEAELPGETVTFHYLDRPGLQLVNEMMDKQSVILVDALDMSSQHGKCMALEADDLLIEDTTISSHQVSLSGALQMAKTLNTLPAHLSIYGLAVDMQRSLDEPLIKNTVHQLTHLLRQQLSQ